MANKKKKNNQNKNQNQNQNQKKQNNNKNSANNGVMKKAVQKAIDQSEVHTGKVKFMDIRKGYGFIIDDKTGKEIFFHHTGIESGRTYKGFMNEDVISYKLVPGEKGPEAVSIILDPISKKGPVEKTEEAVEETAETVEEETQEATDPNEDNEEASEE